MVGCPTGYCRNPQRKGVIVEIPTVAGARDMDKIVEGKKVKVVGVWIRATPQSPVTLTVTDSAGEINFIWSDAYVQPTTNMPGCWEMTVNSEMVKPVGFYTVSSVSGGPIPEPERPKYWGRKAVKIDRGRSSVHHT